MLGTQYGLPYVLQCEAMHFITSGLVGLLVFSMTWTISLWAWPALVTSRLWWLPRSFAWACSLCASLAIHWYADLAGLGF